MFANKKKKEEENSSSSSSCCMDAVWMRGSFAICAMLALVVWAAVTGQEARERAGGVRDAPEGTENSFQMDELARFAVAEHNKKENTLLEFSRVVKVREQVVAGMLYFLIVEAADSGTNRLYEAKVWVMPWMNFKQLTDFKLIEKSGTVISQDT